MSESATITPPRMLEFKDLLRALIRERLETQEALAAQLGVAQKTISLTVLGKLLPPIDERLDLWADALGLQGEDRRAFRRAAMLAHTPEAIRLELQQKTAAIADLESRVAHLAMTVSDLLRQAPPRE